jgi:hypothetical protein
MRRLPIAVAACLAVIAVGGCRLTHTAGAGAGGSAEKGNFVSAADRICANHLRTVLAWLGQPRSGNLSHQAAVTNQGIYDIISTTIGRLESLGQAPGPDAGAFDGYVGTLKARASLYMLLRIANDHRDGVTALRFQRRIDEIDTLGDRDAHRYGLRVCGTSGADVAKAFSSLARH